MTTVSTFTAIPNRSTDTPEEFVANADTTMGEFNGIITQINTLASTLNSIAAGTAMAIPYTFSTTTSDSDPGAGYLRLDNATQNTATTIRADLVGSDGSTWTGVIDTFDDSTSAIKGQIMLVNAADATKWIIYNVTSLASPSGYKNITVSNVSSSAASPFANGDSIILKFTRVGDKGDVGTGDFVFLSKVTASDSATVDIETTFNSTYNNYLIVVSNMGSDGSQTPEIRVQMKIGGSYLSTATYYSNCGGSFQSDANDTYRTRKVSGGTYIDIIPAGAESASSNNISINMMVREPASTSLIKMIDWQASYRCGITYTGPAIINGAGYNTGTAALTGIRFFVDSGNIKRGTFSLYGMRS